MSTAMAKMAPERRRALLRRADTLIGALLCGMAAAIASVFSASYNWRVVVPLVFTAVLLLIASLFGFRAGIFGTILAALIFAAFLFTPVGSVRVASDAARANLGWMLLIGLGFSLLFAPPNSTIRRH